MEDRAKTNVVKISREVPAIKEAGDYGFFYLPVNIQGSAVEPKRAIRLECWRYTGVRRQRLFVAENLKYALVRQPTVEHFHLLSDVFQSMGDGGIPWLTCIHRCVEGDVHMPKFQSVELTS